MNSTQKSSLNSFMELAKSGHYPLFFNEWFSENTMQRQDMTIKFATEHLKLAFERLDKHKTLAKKQTLLMSLEPEKRQMLICSFLKLVEFNALKDIKSLH